MTIDRMVLAFAGSFILIGRKNKPSEPKIGVYKDE